MVVHAPTQQKLAYSKRWVYVPAPDLTAGNVMKAGAKSKIGAAVGNGRANRLEDVLWLKQALHDLGRYGDRGERHG